MKTVIEINTCDYGSTGKIMLQLAEAINESGNRCYIVVPNGRHNPWSNKPHYIKFGNRISEDLHIILGYLTGFQGCFSFFSTANLIRKLKKIKPDIIHLHNLHKNYINIPLLFRYIKKSNISVVWTLHDCWSFTGQCPHYTFVGCNKWKTGCFNCPSYREYPSSLFDNTKTMYRLKKKWFCGVKKMTLVTPSKWLENQVKESFLKDYPVKVINNGIDLTTFKPRNSDFKKKYNIPNSMFIVLGVAFDWSLKKGIDVFIELSKLLDKDVYRIVLVGTNSEMDKSLPRNILSIGKTQDQNELAAIYSSADVFVNPTREDNYPTVNMEAIACGTPVITFKTGGSPEIVDSTCGYVVPYNDIKKLKKRIVEVCNNRFFSIDNCLSRASFFDKNIKYCDYMNLLL